MLFVDLDSNSQFRPKVNKMHCSSEGQRHTWGSQPLTSSEALRMLHNILDLSIFLLTMRMIEGIWEFSVSKSNCDYLTFVD